MVLRQVLSRTLWRQVGNLPPRPIVHQRRSFPGIGYSFATSSIAGTQSFPFPIDGGVNPFFPVPSNVPIASAVPRRGSYQYAFTCFPDSFSKSTVNGWPDAE